MVKLSEQESDSGVSLCSVPHGIILFNDINRFYDNNRT